MPLVSTDNELKNTLRITKYKPLNESKDMVGKASFFASVINSIDGSDVRISKRVKVPSHRLRGFEKGKIDLSITVILLVKSCNSYKFFTNLPSILPTFENLDFSYFIDIANVWGVDYDSSIDDSNEIRSSGLALEFISPVGPLSFSLSQPINKKSSDKTESFRFNLGTTF